MIQNFTSTCIDNIEVRNFRCFTHLKIDFHERLTVLVAPNGGGKTAVLDLLATALRPFVDTMLTKSASRGFSHSDVRMVLSTEKTMEPVLPISFTAHGLFFKQVVSWRLERQSSSKNAKVNMKP